MFATSNRLTYATRLFLVYLLLGVSLIGCQDKAPGISRGQAIDTASFHAVLRHQAALPLGNPEKEFRLRQILKDAIKLGYNDKACLLSIDLARHHADAGNMDSCRYYFEQARRFCEQPIYDSTLPATFLAEYGAFYHSLRGDQVAANEAYYKALSYLKDKQLTENELTINLYYYLVGTNERLGRHEQALEYLQEGEKLAEKLGSHQALVAIRSLFGDYYFERKNYPLARQYYERALSMVDSSWNPEWEPNILISLFVGQGSVLTVLGEAEQAIPFLNRAILTAQQNHIVYSEVAATIELGTAYNHLKRYGETVRLVEAALERFGTAFNWKREDGYRVLMEAYEGLGQAQKALDYQRGLHALRDSLMGTEKTAALHELELKFQTANKDKEIASKRLQIEQQKSRLSQLRFLIVIISAVALLLVAILVMRYRAAAQRQQLQQLELQSLRREQEIKLLRAGIDGEEQERKRLARELHDGIGAMIFSAIMRISLLKKKEPGAVTPKDFDDVLQLLEQTGSEVRKTAHNMMPDILAEQSLFEAVQTYCQTITLSSALEIDVQFYGADLEFTADVKLLIYRIIQELVHNIVKHARASHAIVQGVLHEDQFSITVEDNGRGFNSKAASQGLGLKNLESRVKSLHGSFQIETSPDQGTSIYMEFPVHALMTTKS